jgi:DNA replication protein DnaC
VINTLSTAQTKGMLKTQLKRYLSPAILALDEVGYLPIDYCGADPLFQVISQRYERGSIILSSSFCRSTSRLSAGESISLRLAMYWLPLADFSRRCCRYWCAQA